MRVIARGDCMLSSDGDCRKANAWTKVNLKTVVVCRLLSGGVFFFFQAEDGIRDYKVTGVQTCALPISICRCKFDSSTASGSMRPIVPTPAKANARAAGDPRPPTPTTNTFPSCTRGADRKSVV